MVRLIVLIWILGKIAALLLWSQPFGRMASAACFFLPDLFILYHLFVPSSQIFCRVFTRFETDQPEIWLTIDDGPDETDTPQILDLLDRHSARATFFLIGERVVKYPGLVAEILRRGHEVAHHTHTHPTRTFWCAGPARTGAELDQCLTAMRRVGTRPRWFRLPVGFKNFFLQSALTKRSLRCIGWSIRSYDSIICDPVKIAARVTAQLRPGAIVVMHEGEWLDQRVRVQALALVLDELTARKFRCVLPEERQLR